MTAFIKEFCKSERGAVTVDWVVVCAGVVAIAVIMVAEMNAGATKLTAETGTYMSNFR
ncbi:hypothetical protein [uncultured Tateyamaria sp.]|uniref:hypothetical protein n=1 Tax=uncultured Tateyamaria sp. TaxID=455651 RepID=UPI002625C39E|nr:hypothetical protein [uncultured Tateyamaria sp.]